jgi:hypothetical protein
MSSVLVPLLLLLLTMPLVVALMRANELFALRMRQGRLQLVRGRIPPRLLSDIDDVLQRAGAGRVDLRGVVEDGRATLRVAGGALEPTTMQRLRNTISLWPVAKIRNASRKA